MCPVQSFDDTDQLIETIEVDSKSWYTLGRSANVSGLLLIPHACIDTAL